MITFQTGDIFKSDAEAIVNPVNCVGVMGRGLALEFKKKYPANFKAYAAACKYQEVQLGRMFVFETGEIVNPRYIINFPTKRHWRAKSRMEDIEAGLDALVQEIKTRNIRSIAIPPLGSDLGKLQWADVRPRIQSALQGLDGLEATVLEPGSGNGTVDRRPNRARSAPKLTLARAASIALIHRYWGGAQSFALSLQEVHQLMYFLQKAGEPLRLGFKKATHGPYAANLEKVLHPMDGHYIYGYERGGDDLDLELKLVPMAVLDAQTFLSDKPKTIDRIDIVAQLIEEFESPTSLELLATVHWVAAEPPKPGLEEVIARTYQWNERKRQFSERQIGIAYRRLKEQGWLDEAAACRA